MTDNGDRIVKTGGDPRALVDFIALREEISKLTHPARPDVEWKRVEQLCLSLFRQNGVELQTAAWYTLARTHLAGMHGLNEGLAILEALIIHQWGTLWPQTEHVRLEILAVLSRRLLAVLRTMNLTCAALPLIYQAEQHLNRLQDRLQRLELKNAGQLTALAVFMYNAAARLQKGEAGHDDVTLPPPATPQRCSPAVPEPWIYVACDAAATPPENERVSVKPARQWKGFAAGMLTSLIIGIAGVLWHGQRAASHASLLPIAANAHSLAELARQSPLWLHHYGFMLAAQARPPESGALKAQWQHQITANALPLEALSGWHQGMEGLRDLTARLNALDERKGKYLTGSELKSMVFAITRNFERAVPLEEQLYLLNQTKRGERLPADQVLQAEHHLNQLLNRYMLITQQAEGQDTPRQGGGGPL